MSNISIIIPVHELDETTKVTLTNAITSVKEQVVRPSELIIVVPKGSDAASYIKDYDFGDLATSVVIAENEGATDFATQFNYGVKVAKSEWVSLLEYDDELAKIWLKNVVEYRTAYPDVAIFMPIVVDVDQNNQFNGFTNEAVWAQNFSDELGILDNNALLMYQNFNVDGFVMKKSTYEEFGGFKSNIPLTFIYEFLLRMTFLSLKTMVIPKFGYKHVNLRPNSLFSNYRNTLSPLDAKWWLAQAKKEYFFVKDRVITKVQETV
jgi:glycosyltransferase involved in cell wall biosynthesis